MVSVGVILSAPRRGSARLCWVITGCVLLLSSFAGVCGHAQQRKPDLVLRGTVTYANRQTYLELPFAVGKDVSRISVELSYTEHDKHTNIDLGVFDPQRFRGWSGGNKSFFTISETDATPSYLPGVVVPGKWKLILGVPNIEEGVRSDYEAKIYFSHRKDVLEGSTFSQKPLREGAAWYRGDLHMHNAHSDGSCLSQSGQKVPCPLYKTVEDAANRKLDFIAITDHNTMSQYNDMRELQPYFDKLLLMPGREVTTFDGHANVFGTTEFIDFRLTSPHVPTVNDLLKQVEEVHGLISINHPGSPSGAACMGCGWTAPDTDYSRVNAIEAINGGSLDGPRSGIPFWQDKLNKGFRLTAIGGSDNHDADYGPSIRSAVGHPTTVVYAPNLTEEAILNGIRAGHAFVDIVGTSDRTLELTASAGTTTASMGDVLASPAGQQIHFTVKMLALENEHAEVILDGDLTTLVDASPAQATEETRSFDYQSDGKRHWLRVNIRSADGSLLLVGNPIYLNF
ncbi:hypothetical protein HNQ77_000781 [Silvibacterium bohemicum]|uniref:Phosphotransferase n=1 Tax=Silvibacterium bohemicum TaxID=1577686 RepID=A0A841JNL2_9BACT|nr:CehA/McbA family metallohydrolase [Silvibacterium bohemicum]MBB6142843.1 hypothetical protein [Silvibacterium bohemicum]